MADGKIQLYGGKVLVDPGAVATADECCCRDFTSCETDQPPLTFVLSGSCGGDWCDDISSPSGNGGLFDYRPSQDDIYWMWKVGETGVFPIEWYVYLYRCIPEDTFCAAVKAGPGHSYYLYGGDEDNCDCGGGNPYTDVTDAIGCSGDTLTGEFTLDGVACGTGYCNCTGCSITITLDGVLP